MRKCTTTTTKKEKATYTTVSCGRSADIANIHLYRCIYLVIRDLDRLNPETTETPIQMRGGAIRSWLGAWRYRCRVGPIPLSSSLRKWPQFQSSFRCSLTTWGGGAQPIIQRFPSLIITRDGVTPRGAFAESQAVFLNPDPDEVIDVDRKLKKGNMGLVSGGCIRCVSG